LNEGKETITGHYFYRQLHLGNEGRQGKCIDDNIQQNPY
jgi:hypothetical protein